MTTLHEIGALLKSYRKKSGLTLSALAERSNLHRNTLSALEHGVGNVELNTLLAVCEQLGLDLVPTPRRIAALFREEYKDEVQPLSPQRSWSTLAETRPLKYVDAPTALQKRIYTRLASTVKLKNEDKK